MPQNEDCAHFSTVFVQVLKSGQREKMIISDSGLGDVVFQET